MRFDLSEQQIDELRQTLATDGKIDAIKLYREWTGAGLAEAKDFVERLASGQPAAPPPGRPDISQEEMDQINEALFAGQKIEAIKIYRSATGQGLKDSKDFMDQLEAHLRGQSPEKFVKAAGSGCGSAVVLLSTTSAAIYYLCDIL